MYSRGVIMNADREGTKFGAVPSWPRQTKTGEGGASGTSLAIQRTCTENFRVLQIVRQSLTGFLGLTAETVMLME